MNAEQRLMSTLGVPATVADWEGKGGRLHYLTAGAGAPLVLLHGLTLGWGQWAPMIGPLSRRGSLLAVDLPGCGKSSAVDFPSADLEEAFVAPLVTFFSDRLREPCTLMAHSFGAWIAVKLARRKPELVRQLILVDPLGYIDWMPSSYRPLAFLPLARFLSKTVMSPTPQHLRSFLQTAYHRPMDVPEALIDYICENIADDPSRRHPFFLLHRLSGWMRMRQETRLAQDFAQLTCPVTVISGVHDPFIPAARLTGAVAAFPEQKLQMISDSGHVPFVEQPEQFLRALAPCFSGAI